MLGAGRMLADFEAGLQGVRAGEQKTIELTFPANYGAPALAGKKAQFAVDGEDRRGAAAARARR